MGNSFSVQAAELQAAEPYLNDIATEATARLKRVRHEVESLLGSGWSGAAAAGFSRGWEQWHTGCVEAIDAVEKMAGLVGEAGRAYVETDVAGSDSLRAAGAS